MVPEPLRRLQYKTSRESLPFPIPLRLTSMDGPNSIVFGQTDHCSLAFGARDFITVWGEGGFHYTQGC